HVRRRDLPRQRDALRIDQDRLLDAGTAAICGISPAVLDAAKGPREGAIDGGAGPVDPVRVAEAVEQDLIQAEPDACLLPGLQPAPARHAAAAAHLAGEILPGDPRFEDKEDAGQGLAILHGLASGEAETPGLARRQQ